MNDAVKLLPCPVCKQDELTQWIETVGDGRQELAIKNVLPRFAKAKQPYVRQAIEDVIADLKSWRSHVSPTPREQELEAQNKALWDALLEIAALGNHFGGDLDTAKDIARAAIQKAKGEK